jgi:hypothetical protein
MTESVDLHRNPDPTWTKKDHPQILHDTKAFVLGFAYVVLSAAVRLDRMTRPRVCAVLQRRPDTDRKKSRAARSNGTPSRLRCIATQTRHRQNEKTDSPSR